MLKYLRLIGFAEGSSFLLLLLIAMPMKYMMGLPQAVRVVGMLHGILFLIYVLLATIYAMDAKWSMKKLFLAYVASVVPLGTFVFDKKYLSVEKEVEA